MGDDFGKLLRHRRRELGLTQGQLARALGLSIAYVSEVERGNRAPFTGAAIMTAASLLQMNADALLELAAHSRGAFQLSADVSPKAREVGAALMRGWGELSDDTLEAIYQLVGKRGEGSK